MCGTTLLTIASRTAGGCGGRPEQCGCPTGTQGGEHPWAQRPTSSQGQSVRTKSSSCSKGAAPARGQEVPAVNHLLVDALPRVQGAGCRGRRWHRPRGTEPWGPPAALGVNRKQLLFTRTATHQPGKAEPGSSAPSTQGHRRERIPRSTPPG